MNESGGVRVVFLTAVAMCAFAANSLLCRLALGLELIDAASFASVRVLSGALTLVLISLPKLRGRRRLAGDWRAAVMLFVYMAGFSFAYISLSAGTGALLLFGAVQLTMLLLALWSGERLSAPSWLGFAVAIAGLIYLVSPGVTAPDPVGAALMTVAGVAWGLYSLLGRKASDPIEATAFNFVWCIPLVLILSLIFRSDFSVTVAGFGLAIGSGALASGLGYVAWYSALKYLTAMRAATVQLIVPVLAALAAVPLLSEALDVRLLIASIATLGGIGLVLAQRVGK